MVAPIRPQVERKKQVKLQSVEQREVVVNPTKDVGWN